MHNFTPCLSNSISSGIFDANDPGPFIKDRNTMVVLINDIMQLCVETAFTMEHTGYKPPLALYFIHTEASRWLHRPVFFRPFRNSLTNAHPFTCPGIRSWTWHDDSHLYIRVGNPNFQQWFLQLRRPSMFLQAVARVLSNVRVESGCQEASIDVIAF